MSCGIRYFREILEPNEKLKNINLLYLKEKNLKTAWTIIHIFGVSRCLLFMKKKKLIMDHIFFFRRVESVASNLYHKIHSYDSKIARVI